MRTFVTDGRPAADDWECVEDFFGSWSGFGFSDRLNVTAWFSPSRKSVWFGGDWRGVPEMPVDSAPTEEACWSWAEASETVWAKRLAAARRRAAAHEAHIAETDAHFRFHGYNWISVVLRRVDGFERTVSEVCGRRDRFEVLRAAVRYMLKHEPAGTRIAAFRFETGLSEEEVRLRQQGGPSRKRRACRRTEYPVPQAA